VKFYNDDHGTDTNSTFSVPTCEFNIFWFDHLTQKIYSGFLPHLNFFLAQNWNCCFGMWSKTNEQNRSRCDFALLDLEFHI